MDGRILEVFEGEQEMTTCTSPFTKEGAVVRACRYLKDQGFDEDFEVHEVYYQDELDGDQLRQVPFELGRPMTDDEAVLLRLHNKRRWVVQFISEECEPGTTPQGPSVFVNDDGTVSHYVPM